MNRLAYAFAAPLAAIAMMASAAEAATYINYSSVGSDGGFSITFGNTGITDPSFSDTFDFTMPSGVADFVVTSTMSSGSQNIDFTSVAFNGAEFDASVIGWNEFSFLNGVSVTKDALQRLVLSGTSGGNGSYSGVITFMPTTAAVPEPASWALLILGFGGAGAALRQARRNRTALQTVA